MIEKGRCDLFEAPLWAFELARIGDNVMGEELEKRRKKQERNLKSNRSGIATPWQG